MSQRSIQNQAFVDKNLRNDKDNSGQSYKAPTIVIYDSRVVTDLKLPHITTLES